MEYDEQGTVLENFSCLKLLGDSRYLDFVALSFFFDCQISHPESNIDLFVFCFSCAENDQWNDYK